MLTRADFDVAVKEALRHYARADLLLGSPLLEMRIASGHGSKTADAAHLQAVLADAAEAIFVSERDQRLLRVLELTYFRPAPKQEAVAERLGLSFSTYRRHLTTGVERLTEWLWHQEQERPHSNGRPVDSDVPPAAADAAERPRLSVVVLPFLNLSQDSSLDYLVDGIVDHLLTDLSRALPGSFVVSRSTAFSYKGRQVPTRQVGEELRVRYVLEGSVLTDASRVRVNAQLVDAQTDEHLWAERFDKERRDILQVQDEIVARLARTVGVEMVRNEGRRSESRSGAYDDALDMVMRGNAVATDLSRKERAVEAVALFTRALELDPDNVDAMVGIAATRIFQVVNQFQTVGREALLDEAEALISRAVGLAPDHIGVMKARAVLLRARGRFEDAIIADMSVIAINPGEPTAYRELGLNNLYLGRPQDAVDWFRRAETITPRDRVRWTWLQGLGRALMHLGRDTEAVEALRLAVHSNPHLSRDRAFLAAAEALVGNIDDASRHLAKYDEIDPGMTVQRFAEERNSVPLEAVSPAYLRGDERILKGLRRAGMPER
ncbi:MAG TPA: tetratricopeptide repeat protein [Acetobacteraceae bacterium]|jgi:TolB-like protein/Flp pilus assembly protein TadD|nr:tetratricopeptide repeat protein [Acetobacteraceae bacterium]